MSCGNRIIRDFVRPDKALVEAFRGIPAANIDDNMNRVAAVADRIRPLNHVPMVGTAFTVRVPQGDNLMFHAALDLAKPGDVIVIDADNSRDRAIFGGNMATYCQIRGIAGIVCDGAIRDVADLEALDMAVYATGTTPNGPYKNGPGEINVPISIGGVIVRPGDILVGDRDGVVVIPAECAEEILIAARKTVEKETNTLIKMKESGLYPRPWVDEKLKEIGCEII